VIFGSCFNNIVINRFDANNNITQVINTPVIYAQKEKMLARVVGDPDINRKDAIILPAISFEIKDMVYDTNRKFNTIDRYASNLSNTSVNFSYSPVPYDIHFNVYIYVKNNEDAAKIIEQILPFFTPDFTVKATMFPNIPSVAVPIILNGVQIDDNNDSDFKNRRVLIWNLGFTLQALFYGPVKTSPVINFTNVAIGVWEGNNAPTLFKEFGLEDISDFANTYTINTNTAVTDNSAGIFITTSSNLTGNVA
jgi:hypothetical protein